ncbi:MAG: nucleoside-diphosphate sugar epimerase/dehydratase [bacterium]
MAGFQGRLLTRGPHDWALSSPFVKYRLVLILPVHMMLFALSMYWAFLLRFEWEIPELYSATLPLVIALTVTVRTAAFLLFRAFQGMVRRVSFYDLVTLAKAITLGSLLLLPLKPLLSAWHLPLSIILIDWLLVMCLIGGLRMVSRLWGQSLYPRGTFKRSLFVGDLPDLELIINYLKRSTSGQFFPIACLDQSLVHHGIRINGVPVWSQLEGIPRLIRRNGVQEVVFCSREPSNQVMNYLLDASGDLPLSFKILPPLDNVFSQNGNGRFIRDLHIEDLLDRDPAQLDESAVGQHLKGSRILVTGAGGSIGRELCLQMARFKPELIVLYDRYEGNLYSIQLELSERYPFQPVRTVLGTISDAHGFSRLLGEVRADIVFHCAAYKHVPVVELNPIEAGYNNILGTRHVARAACEHGVRKFIMISTDKAVNPTNVMGASKRLAEMYVQTLSQRGPTKFITVRFGNVLNSAGSVIPRFMEQIREGGPVTVTHPDIVRFFMTIPEACQLVLQASAMGHGGEIFVLNMGRPVKIVEIAKRLVRLAGRSEHDVPIVFTGLRPGEKLYEELFDNNETPVPTASRQIFMANGLCFDFDWIEKEILEIERMVFDRNEVGIIRKLNEIVPNCSCGKEIIEKYAEAPTQRNLEWAVPRTEESLS